MSSTAIPEVGGKRVCSMCMPEDFLSAQIEESGIPANCSYCEFDGNTFSVEEIAISVRTILEEFYSWREPPDGRPVNAVIADLIGGNLEAADDIRSLLEAAYAAEREDAARENNIFGTNECYARAIHLSHFQLGWWDFERNLKTHARHFNREAESWLSSLFEGIERCHTKFGKPIVVDAGPGTALTKLYRARVFESEIKLREAIKLPSVELGPPPSPRATAGRMNAAGIGLFYGATESAVALAEVRPPVGSKVLVGCFEILRSLRLLDLVAIKNISDEPGSLFDEEHRERLKQLEFLRGLGVLLSKPVMPDDEIIDYIPTQAIADFLAAEVDPSLDGIIYPSVQIGTDIPSIHGMFSGRRGAYRCNVVLFQKAASVQSMDTNSTIKVFDNSPWYSSFASVDDGPDVIYSVWVTDPHGEAAETDERDEVSLRFAFQEVHYVSAVEVKTRSSEIPRYRATESERASGAPETPSGE